MIRCVQRLASFRRNKRQRFDPPSLHPIRAIRPQRRAQLPLQVTLRQEVCQLVQPTAASANAPVLGGCPLGAQVTLEVNRTDSVKKEYSHESPTVDDFGLTG